MTDQPNLPRGYRGQARVERPVLELGPFDPWHATVRIVPLELRRGVTFQVICAWTGPPAVYMPADERAGDRQDIYTTGDLQLAKAIAHTAAEQLRQARLVDLRDVAEQVRARIAAGPYG